MTTVFPLHNKPHTKQLMFMDSGVNIARYDKVKYNAFIGFIKQQLGYFWQPSEIDLTKDNADFKKLTPQEQHIFTSNLKRQTMLDSIQGRAPALAYGPIVSLPEVETWIYWWSAFEQLHNLSYQHIMQNIYNDPTKEFDAIVGIDQIVDSAKEIAKYYDSLIKYNNKNNQTYDHKVALWKALIATYALEGIRFYVSFACSWAFAETARMEGNAKIIKFICRDENIHLGAVQLMLKILPRDDNDFEQIRNSTIDQSRQIIIDVAEQEITWADYLFRNGSMLGLNSELLKQYVQWITDKRLTTLGYETHYKAGVNNPLPWTQKWIAGGDVQVAPQETQISSYTQGDVKQDITKDILEGLSL